MVSKISAFILSIFLSLWAAKVGEPNFFWVNRQVLIRTIHFSFERFVGVTVGVALALVKELRNLHAKSQ